MSDPVFVYRITDLPELLSGPVSAADPITACQFYAARGGSKAVAAAFAQVPEPPCADVPRWLEVASLAGQGLARQRSLVDLAPVDGSGGRVSFGFHSGDAAAFLAALREAGAEVIDAAPLIASIAWLEIEGMEPVYERWARDGTVVYSSLTPVRPAAPERPALYALPIDVQPDLRAHTLFSRSGAALDASFLQKGGGHRRAFPPLVRPALDVPAASVERAAALLSAVHAEPMWYGDAAAIVTIDGPNEGRLVATIAIEQGGFELERRTTALDVVPLQHPIDARYEALLFGTRDALIDCGQPPSDPSMLVPLLLLEDATLTHRDDFRAAYFEVARYAGLLAQRETAVWRALGVQGPMGIAHGLASPAFIDHAGHLAWTLDQLLEGLRVTLEAMPGAEALATRKAILNRWTRRLLGSEIHGSVGFVGDEIHRKMYLDLHYLHGLPLEDVNAIVNAEIIRACGS